MKTAGRENPNHRATLPHNRAHGAVGQNRFRSIRGAVKQEKFRPLERCFFLTLPFIEPSTWRGRSEQISLDQGGCEARKIPAAGEVFFLDFTFYRTYQDLAPHVDIAIHRDEQLLTFSERYYIWHIGICSVKFKIGLR
jgi:hypothetical protein